MRQLNSTNVTTLRCQLERAESSDIKMSKVPQQEIVSTVIEMNRLFEMKDTDINGNSAFNIGSAGQTSAVEEVRGKLERQTWQYSGFWHYLALLNKTQPDQSKLCMAALKTCEYEHRKRKKRN
jgi:hypothetical protein